MGDAKVKYVILTGNPADGFDVIGPFDGLEAAIQYARANIPAEWWATVLESPDVK
jgi:hypothetical protein